MAVRTSASAGDFKVGSNWVGGVAPGVGDSAVIGHLMTLSAVGGPADVGDGVSDAISFTSGGGLTTSGDPANVGAVALVLRGQFDGTNGSVLWGDGTIIEMLPGSGDAFTIKPGDNHIQWHGTTARPVRVRANGGAAGTWHWEIGTASGTRGAFGLKGPTGSSVFLEDMGSDTVSSFGFNTPGTNVQLRPAEAPNGVFDPGHVHFDNCGIIRFTHWGIAADESVNWDGLVVTNTQSTTQALWVDGEINDSNVPSDPNNGVARNFKNVHCDGTVLMRFMCNWEVEDLVINLLNHTPSEHPMATAKRWFLLDSQDVRYANAAAPEDIYYRSNRQNGHGFVMTDLVTDSVMSRYVFDNPVIPVADTGDAIVVGGAAPAAQVNFEIRDSVSLPNPNAGRDSVFITLNGAISNFKVFVRNCVAKIPSLNPAFNSGEAQPTPADSLSVRDSIAWSDLVEQYAAGAEDHDTLDAIADFNFNGVYNGRTDGANGVVDAAMTSGPTGIVSDDPQFTDTTRSVDSWAGTVGLAATAQAAFDQLMLLDSDVGYDADVNIPDLISYVLEGFNPAAPSYQTGSESGGKLGISSLSGGNPGGGGGDAAIPAMVGRSVLVG